MKGTIEEFKEYVLEQYGYELSFDESDIPDTFEKIFGGSFLDAQDEVFYSESGKKYNANVADITINMLNSSTFGEYELQQFDVLAA